jgi:outer membrane lipopolysaccharide assembly protein LptE/RlpB
LAAILTLAFSCLSGCGYHTINQESAIRFGEGKTVSIPIFANKTYKPNLEIALVNNLIDEFSKRNGLRVVDSKTSDYTLSGEVLGYYKLPIAYTAYDIVKEYKAYMTVTATLRKNSNMQVVWKGELSWNQDFPASSDIAIQQNSEDAAILEISKRLAQQMFLKISSDF